MMRFRTTYYESRKSPEEIQAITKRSSANKNCICRQISKKSISWGVLKGAFFIVCATCFTIQSMEFYMYYRTYPTTTNIEVSTQGTFIRPAVTFCNRNPMPRTSFCYQYPDLCAEPDDISDFCLKHPRFCKKDTSISYLQIPRVGYYTRTSYKVTEMAQKLHLNMKLDPYSHFLKAYSSREMKITFVREYVTHNYVKCYSSNFHFYDKNEPETIKMDPSIDSAVKKLYEFSAEIAEEESFYPWITTQVYFFIHSPFTSVNPFQKGIALKSGYQYNIDIKLEEEHLLPYPYHTDCTNYEALWIKNNKTGPRSQQMCREVCELSSVRQCYSCDKKLIMVEEPKNLCFDNPECNEKKKVLDNRTLCQRNCKADCLKLKYRYTINSEPLLPLMSNSLIKRDSSHESVIIIYMRDPEVTIMSHIPLYSPGELFSHIGGLIGYWLGISVWASIGIAESTFRSFHQVLKRFRKRRQAVQDPVLSPPILY